MTLVQLIALLIEAATAIEPGIYALIQLIAAQQLEATQQRFVEVCAANILPVFAGADAIFTADERRAAATRAIVATAADWTAAGEPIDPDAINEAIALIEKLHA